ncbi:MAG: sugar phosphate nucleotidyltransferase [Bacteroidota bacterium]
MSSIIRSNIWGIILAGGDGVRLKNYLAREFHFSKPKQFCNIIGTRSLFKHTYDRASMIIPKNQIITVITDKQFGYIENEIDEFNLDLIVSQPSNKDTGPAMLLPIMKLYQNDPNSIIAFFPSDHFILEERTFLDHIEESIEFVSIHDDNIILLGIKPYCYTESYGYIVPGEVISHSGMRSINKVNIFLEKPNLASYKGQISNAFLWNSMVIVGKCKTFIKVIQRSLPNMFMLFKNLFKESERNNNYLSYMSLFNSIPKINFSKDILEKIVENLLVMNVEDVFWSDWGEEEKILYTLSKLEEMNEVKIFA